MRTGLIDAADRTWTTLIFLTEDGSALVACAGWPLPLAAGKPPLQEFDPVALSGLHSGFVPQFVGAPSAALMRRRSRPLMSGLDVSRLADVPDPRSTRQRRVRGHRVEGIGRRLHDLALTDGHQEVARALTYAFGEATCPECGQRFSIVGQIVACSS